jgi:hypothetical protein
MDAAPKGKTPIQLGPRQSMAEPGLNAWMTNATQTNAAQVGT